MSILAMLLSITACSAGAAERTGRMDSLTIGMDTTAVNTLIYIALDKGFFTSNNLQVNTKTYASGLAAVNDMLDKSAVDLATASEFVLVGKAMSGQKVHAVSSIDELMHNYIIARKDRGIQSISDLEGKTIGVPLKTAAEFYLGRFLELNGVNLERVTLVNENPADLVEALTSGKEDAVVAWQPNARNLLDRLGNGVVSWPAQSEQATYALLMSTTTWTGEHPDVVRRLLTALSQAEAWYTSHPEETKGILKERLGFDDSYIATIWPEHQFQISLDQSLILTMEDESRWMIRHQLTDAKHTPVFLDYLYLDGLQTVRPEAVNIIR